jgi:phosphatidate cytidylyltransferase
MPDMNASEASAPRKSFLHSSIFLRVAASVVFIPCFIIITRTGGYHFLALINALIFIGMWEFYRMLEVKGTRPYKIIGIVCGLILSWYVFFRNGMYANLFLTLALITLMCMELTRRQAREAVYHISSTVFGVIYVAFLGSHLILLREHPLSISLDYSMGASFVFLAVVVTWAGDTGAYIVGKTMGRHPLLPRVSEKKTREGSVGGLVFSVAGVLLAKQTFAPYLELWQALLLGVMAGAMGQLGDLCESLVKRDLNVKDASDTIPGHGGILDRFDSLLFTAPLTYYFIRFVIFK